MSMLGVDKIGSLSNCFVIGQPEDSYGGILQKDEQLVQLMKRRGGVGIDISTLRPSGTDVTNAAKTSTGAASFMERFSNSTREVAQGGRRGALDDYY
jgi:ribonucleoside-diphosphate reductase alpha chain